MENVNITAERAKDQYLDIDTRNLTRILRYINDRSREEKFFTQQGTLTAEVVKGLEAKGFVVTSIGTKSEPVVRVDWGWQEVKE